MKKVLLLLLTAFMFNSCATYNAAGNLEEGALDTFMTMWDRWTKSNGDIAYTTVWERKVDPELTADEVKEAIRSIGIEANMKSVGELPLGEELNARGIKSGTLHVMSYCSPDIARIMVDFTASAAAYLPCRITLVDHGKKSDIKGEDMRNGVDQKEGLWLYTLNMDMMIKMGRKMPPEVIEKTMFVRNTIWNMMEAGATGDF